MSWLDSKRFQSLETVVLTVLSQNPIDVVKMLARRVTTFKDYRESPFVFKCHPESLFQSQIQSVFN